MPTLKKPTTKWGDLATVTRWYKKERDARMSQRLNAIRLLMKGETQTKVAELLDVSVATIRNWRSRWDKAGKEGLIPEHIGSRSKVTGGIRLEIKEIIEIKQEIDGQTVTGKLIHGHIKKNT